MSTDSDHERERRTEPTQPASAEDVAELRAERDRLDGQLKRALADLANIRKRHVKELEEARHRGTEALAAELLPVLDNFNLALAAHERHEQQRIGDLPAEAKALADGVRMVRALLEAALERHGIAEIPAEDERFDPAHHEAVGVDPNTDVEAGRVTRVVQRGYRLGERILRASRVLVSGPPPAAGLGEPKKEGEDD
jgi:molecular chaperone GrpE